MSDLTDEEKGEAVRQWWQDNWLAVVGGVVLGIAGLLGWNAWNQHVENRAEQASQHYAQLLELRQSGEPGQAESLVSELTEKGRRTPYAALAWAVLADLALEQGATERALQALQQARDVARDPGYAHLMGLRLARLQIALGRLEQAEATLAPIGDAAFQGLRAELEGDIAWARGQTAEARRRYEQARAAGVDSEFLRLKLDETSV